MIVVAGAPRSGTSFWMQAALSAGYQVLGDPFPSNTRRLKHLNPHGFWESPVRHGINWETNPHKGVYLHPDKTRGLAVKLIGDGVVRTELGYLDRVVHAIRWPGDQIASLRRLDAATGEPRREPHWAVWARCVSSVLYDARLRGYTLVPADFGRIHEPGYIKHVIGKPCDIKPDPPGRSAHYDGPHADDISELYHAALVNGEPSERIVRLTRNALAGADFVRSIFDG